MLDESDRRTTQIPEETRPTMNDIRDKFAHQGLMRPRQGRVLGGVCAGLGRRFGLDPWPARLMFVLVLLVIPGSQILLYPILWLLMPDEGRAFAAQPPSGPVPPATPPAPAV
jgi:phage shock protein C